MTSRKTHFTEAATNVKEHHTKVDTIGVSGGAINGPLPASTRLFSLDALRGFDMFWIMGADSVFRALAPATGSAFFGMVSLQMDHPDWHGFRFYDLIFPLFLFIAGVATPYSVGRQLEKGESKQKLMLGVIRRGLTLVLLGIILNTSLKIIPLSEIRYGSVLGHIGLAYVLASALYLYASFKSQIIWFWGILIGYWMLFLFAAAPGYPAGDLTMEGNIVSYIDRMIMPGELYLGIHDPEGLMSVIPAVATALLGIFAGVILRSNTISQKQKVLRMTLAGVTFVVLGLVLNFVFPINKNLWTSSFVLFAGGISLLLLSLFYYIIDVKGYKKWAFFFKVIGMNSILIYIAGNFINFRYTADAFFQWLFQILENSSYKVVAITICVLLIKWLFLYFLYKKKVFLRV